VTYVVIEISEQSPESRIEFRRQRQQQAIVLCRSQLERLCDMAKRKIGTLVGCRIRQPVRVGSGVRAIGRSITQLGGRYRPIRDQLGKQSLGFALFDHKTAHGIGRRRSSAPALASKKLLECSKQARHLRSKMPSRIQGNCRTHDTIFHVGATVSHGVHGKKRYCGDALPELVCVAQFHASATTHCLSLFERKGDIRDLLIDLNARPCQKLRGSRKSTFEALDKPTLKPLQAKSYECAESKQAKSCIDYR
jgi:hypothetical protein